MGYTLTGIRGGAFRRGKYYVRLEGHVTLDMLSKLVDDHGPNRQADSPHAALPIQPDPWRAR